MTTLSPQPPTSTVTPYLLTLVLSSELGRAVLDRVAVTSKDLLDAYSEAWWEGHLRRGRPDLPLHESRAVLRPVFRAGRADGASGQPWCTGFTLEAGVGPGAGTLCSFPVECLEPLAVQAAARLLRCGILREGDSYVYELRADASPEAEVPLAPGTATPGVRITGPGDEPLRRRTVALTGLLARATAVGPPQGPAQHAVLFLESARRRAERLARRGAEQHPAVETGGVLVGTLVVCPETDDAYVVVTDVLEARDTESSRFSLTFSGATWARIEGVLRARRDQPATASDRLVGSVHGHPFKVGGEQPPCEDCESREICSRTSAFFSDDDRLWSSAVFAGQPWQLGLVFGVDALDRPDHALYGQHGGRLVRRGYHLLPDRVWTAAVAPENAP